MHVRIREAIFKHYTYNLDFFVGFPTPTLFTRNSTLSILIKVKWFILFVLKLNYLFYLCTSILLGDQEAGTELSIIGSLIFYLYIIRIWRTGNKGAHQRSGSFFHFRKSQRDEWGWKAYSAWWQSGDPWPPPPPSWGRVDQAQCPQAKACLTLNPTTTGYAFFMWVRTWSFGFV
jgi:hypothetical protein